MNIQLNTYEVETLEYVLSKFIFQQQQQGLDCELYKRIRTMIAMQRESHTENVMGTLRAQIKRGEKPSTGALQRQEGIGYGRVFKLIEDARAEVEYERMRAEYRKEQK